MVRISGITDSCIENVLASHYTSDGIVYKYEVEELSSTQSSTCQEQK